MSLGLCRGRIEDDDVDFLEMFEKSMQVVELEVATGVVTALCIIHKMHDMSREGRSVRVRPPVRKRLQHSRESRPLEFFR